MNNVDEIIREIQGAGDYRITVLGTRGTGQRRNLATIEGGPDAWRLTSDYILEKTLDAVSRGGDDQRLAARFNHYVDATQDDAGISLNYQPFRGQIPWGVVSFVCDVVHAHGRHSVHIDAMKSVVKQHGSRILRLESQSQEPCGQAVDIPTTAVARAVVLPLRQR